MANGTPSVLTKICGLRDPDHLDAAIKGGARFVGFVFHPESCRAVSVDTAAMLCRKVPAGVKTVGLFVDPSDEELSHIMGRVSLDMIQLHGNETPTRTAEVKNTYAVPVIKAFPISTAEDLTCIKEFEGIADWLLLDAKLTDGSYGGGGDVFDWDILKNHEFSTPWMLAGGLNADNVGGAIAQLAPHAVDVSSGVEIERGQKSPEKIRAFLRSVKKASKN